MEQKDYEFEVSRLNNMYERRDYFQKEKIRDLESDNRRLTKELTRVNNEVSSELRKLNFYVKLITASLIAWSMVWLIIWLVLWAVK